MPAAMRQPSPISPISNRRMQIPAIQFQLIDKFNSEEPNVFICISSFNLRAKKLYDSLGYETIGRIKDYIV